jgi:carbonic anhydrase
MPSTSLTLLTLGAASLIACLHPGQEAHPQAHEGPHWSYEGHDGPQAWGALSPSFRSCAQGRQQSPIDVDISSAELAELPRIAVHYGTTRMIEIDNGHTIEDIVPDGRYVELGATRYALRQFHFHHPSEHTLGGEQFPLEIHLVHTSSTNARLVIGVLVREGAEHRALHALFDHLPDRHDRVQTAMDPAALLPDDHGYATYDGSLTTPPCSENVTWIVMTRPIEASSAQLAQFAARYPHNNRPVMPRNGRHVRVPERR